VAHGLDARAGGGAARFGLFGLIHNVYYVNYGIYRGRPPDMSVLPKLCRLLLNHDVTRNHVVVRQSLPCRSMT
jgi:hypothetical protein